MLVVFQYIAIYCIAALYRDTCHIARFLPVHTPVLNTMQTLFTFLSVAWCQTVAGVVLYIVHFAIFVYKKCWFGVAVIVIAIQTKSKYFALHNLKLNLCIVVLWFLLFSAAEPKQSGRISLSVGIWHWLQNTISHCVCLWTVKSVFCLT